MNIQSRHHTWLIVALLIVALSACTTQPVSSTPSPTPPNQPTPSSTTPNQPTPKPAGPSQTLATFCNAMKASNNATASNYDLATAQFTSRGLQEFQPSTSPPRKAYSSCNYDHVTIFTNSTAGAHLVVVTVGNNRTYQITVTLILDGNRWKIDSWISK